MSEVGKQREKPDGHEKLVYEGSSARTRPTSVEEIMLRRKRKESLANVEEDTVGAAQLLGNDLVQKGSEYQESGKGNDRSKKLIREGVKNSVRKEEGGTSCSREERVDEPMKEDPVGASQVLSNDLVEKFPDYHVPEKGCDKSEKPRREERVKDSSRKREDAISSSKEERADKEDPVGAAQLLGNNLAEEVSDDHVSEKEHERSKKVSREELVKDSSRKREDAISSSKEERLDKEDPVGAAQLLGNDIVEKVSDFHVSDVEHERSKKMSREERVRDGSRKKGATTSNYREEKLDKPMKEDHVRAPQSKRYDLVEKVSDYHASEKEHDRSKKVRPEEHVKNNSRRKEDDISSSREEKLMKKDSAGAAQLLGKDLVEKDSDYHESKKEHERSNKVTREERVKVNSRKKEESISSSREEKRDKPRKEEDANRKRKAEGESETKLAREHIKDRRREKEETNSSCREEKLDKKMKKEDFAANRNIRAEESSLRLK